MNVLITGGAGFIGSNLASFYLERGDSVYVVDNLSTGTIQNILSMLHNPAFRFAEADIMVWNDLNDAINWADRVYHMAAIVGVKKVLEDPRHVIEINIAGAEKIFRAVARVRPDTQIIVASSSEVYGFNTNTSYAETDDIVLRSGAAYAGVMQSRNLLTSILHTHICSSLESKLLLHVFLTPSVVIKQGNTAWWCLLLFVRQCRICQSLFTVTEPRPVLFVMCATR